MIEQGADFTTTNVILRKSRSRDKEAQSIYSRYLKPNIFIFRNRTESADAAVNRGGDKKYCVDSKKSGDERMSGYKGYSYADRVRELLSTNPINPRTQELLNQHSDRQKQRRGDYSPTHFEIKTNRAKDDTDHRRRTLVNAETRLGGNHLKQSSGSKHDPKIVVNVNSRDFPVKTPVVMNVTNHVTRTNINQR